MYGRYEWSGKKHKVSSSASRFSRYAEERGLFSITSVALKDNQVRVKLLLRLISGVKELNLRLQCKREITDLVRRIHPLPSVKIDDGIANLREGDEPAAFSVHFSGTPPFSFTYTRSEIKSGKSKVVETQVRFLSCRARRRFLYFPAHTSLVLNTESSSNQTITDINDSTYTITSSLPGDYQVISISDKYCRYPPLKGRGDI